MSRACKKAIQPFYAAAEVEAYATLGDVITAL